MVPEKGSKGKIDPSRARGTVGIGTRVPGPDAPSLRAAGGGRRRGTQGCNTAVRDGRSGLSAHLSHTGSVSARRYEFVANAQLITDANEMFASLLEWLRTATSNDIDAKDYQVES